MNQSIKRVVSVILVIALLVVVYFVSKRQMAPSASIKIGVIAPMTGNLAFMGEGVRDSILLANQDKSRRYTYEVIVEDDQLDPKLSASAANKLVSVDKVDAIVSFGSGTGNVVSPIAEQNKIVHFSIASDPNVAKGKYNFIHWTPPSEENITLVAELQKRGIKKIGVFESNSQGAAALMVDLRERLKGTGIEIVTDQTFNFGDKDFRSIIAKAKNSGAETYLLLAFSPELEILAKQMKDAGIKTPLTSVESFELSEQVALFEGEWYVNATDPTEDFTARFSEKAGKSPTLGAANAYDIFNLIAFATEKVSGFTKPTSDQVVDELMKISNFSGALGNLSVNQDGLVVSKATVRMIKDGKPVTVK